MKMFVHSQEFKKMNIGLTLDEGLASPTDEVPVYYGERNVYWVKFKIAGEKVLSNLNREFVMNRLLNTLIGNPGHGSRFIENTAAEKAQYLMNQILGYRQKQKKLLEANPDLTLGDVTTVNMTMISGGVQMNVVPNEFTLGFDFRITPTTNLVEFDEMLRKWSEEVRCKFLLTLSSGVVLTALNEN